MGQACLRLGTSVSLRGQQLPVGTGALCLSCSCPSIREADFPFNQRGLLLGFHQGKTNSQLLWGPQANIKVKSPLLPRAFKPLLPVLLDFLGFSLENSFSKGLVLVCWCLRAGGFHCQSVSSTSYFQHLLIFLMSNPFLLFFLSFFFGGGGGHTYGMWKFLGKGSTLRYSSQPSHCSDNGRFLTCCTTREFCFLIFSWALLEFAFHMSSLSLYLDYEYLCVDIIMSMRMYLVSLLCHSSGV